MAVGGRNRLDLGIVEVERAERGPKQEHAQGETEVADAVDQECLHAGRGGRRLLEPEADEQIAAQAHRFPEDIEHQLVAPQPSKLSIVKFPEDEEGHVVEEPPGGPGLLVHVSRGVDHHSECADEGDHGPSMMAVSESGVAGMMFIRKGGVAARAQL